MNPRLYIIMREDLQDMNPGKGMAQAAHAQSDFDAYARTKYNHEEFFSAYKTWCEERSFGVTLALSATLEEMHEIDARTVHSDLTVDPSYPWRNWYGKMFTSNEVTCMWAFVWSDEDIEYMKQFKLHQ
jgi:hypothetical protein